MTCPVDHRPTDPAPFFSDGNIHFKAHDVGWIVSGFFALVASVTSFWLIWKHLTYYTYPLQQRHIVRMLFMVPIYAVVSWMSYFFFRQAIYYETIRDCYEAVVITSFFYLLLQYVGDTRAEQHAVFRNVKLKKWFWPMGFWKYRPTGLHFLWLMKISILQYAIVRPTCTIAAVVLEYFGLYCLDSWAPQFGHIWISITISLSVTVAMYCIIQFYLPIEKELKPYSPVLKFLAVKSVVFLTFWQDSFLSILVFFKVIKPTTYMSSDEVQAGINALLETFEMVIFAFLHIKAFTYLIYRPQDHTRTTSRWRAFVDVIDFRDWARQMKESSRYIYAKSRGREMTVVEDIRSDKYLHLAEALGKERAEALQLEVNKEKEDTATPIPWKHPGDAAGSQTGSPRVRDVELGLEESERKETSRLMGGTRREDLDGDGDDDDADVLLGRRDSSRVATLDYFRGITSRDRHPELAQYHATPLQDVDGDDAVGGEAQRQPQTAAAHPHDRSISAWWRHVREHLSGSHYEDANEDLAEESEPEMEEEKLRDDSNRVALAPLRTRILPHEQIPPREKSSPTSSGSAADSILRERPSPLTELITSNSRDDVVAGEQNRVAVAARPRLVSTTSMQRVPELQQQQRREVGKRTMTYPMVTATVNQQDQSKERPPAQERASLDVKAVSEADREVTTAMHANPHEPSQPRHSLTSAQRHVVVIPPPGSSAPHSEQASVSGFGTSSGPSRHPSSSMAHAPQRQQLRQQLADGKGAAMNSTMGVTLAALPEKTPASLRPPPPRQSGRAHVSSSGRPVAPTSPHPRQRPDTQPQRSPRQAAMSFAPTTHTSERANEDNDAKQPRVTADSSVRSMSSFVTAPTHPGDSNAPAPTQAHRPRRISATGPKGKQIDIKVPNPLSPARFPYGEEGELPARSPAQAMTTSEEKRASALTFGPAPSVSRRDSVDVEGGAEGAVVPAPPSEPTSKARILSGPMSLKQQNEAQREGKVAPQNARADANEKQSPLAASDAGGILRLPGRGKPSTEADAQPRLPAPSQMGDINNHADLYCADVTAMVPGYQQRPSVSTSQRLPPRQNSAPVSVPTASTFAVGQIVTPIQRMSVGYDQRFGHGYSARPPPPHQPRRSSYHPGQHRQQHFAMAPAAVAPRHSNPPRPPRASVNLQGDTRYDRWTGEPSRGTALRTQHLPPQRAPVPGPAPAGNAYDSPWQIEYID